jgi:adenine-specific DNA-methyltransferase
VNSGRLELTWMNKDKVLISPKERRYDYTWVEPTDFRAREIRLVDEVELISGADKRPENQRGDDGLPEPTHDNLLFTGDALHVLEILAKNPEYSEKYAGKVKLVYIDPPFNTGQAFENYEDNLEHSIWLTMLRDRLRQLRPLLAIDATVWVHLDDAEVHRMRAVMDEELGIGNFVGTVIWQKAYSPRNDAQGLSTDQDYILVYSREPDWRSNRFERLASRDALYVSPDGDPRPWVSGDPAAPGAKTHQGMVYAIQSPFTGKLVYPARGRCWGQQQDAMKALIEEWGVPYKREVLDDDERRALICGIDVDEVRKEVPALLVGIDIEESEKIARARHAEGDWPRLYFTKGGNGGLKLKRYLEEVSSDRAPQTLWLHDEVGHNRSAKAEMNALFPDEPAFSTPKPERLIERVLQIASNPGDLVLDFFGGSGTTAAVAHKMGRRWITAELSAANVGRYIKPRLTKVVLGQDSGGITSVGTREPDDDVSLPDGVTPQDAQRFTTLLGKFIETADDMIDVQTFIKAMSRKTKNNPQPITVEDWPEAKVVRSLIDRSVDAYIRSLKAAAKTRSVTTTSWYGGGSFRHVAVGRSMFEQIDEFVVIAEWARGGELARAIAAQFEFRFDDSAYPFAGVKGRRRLAVIDGSVDESLVEHIQSYLADGESAAIYGTGIDPLARAVLSRGSTLDAVPTAILENYRKTVRRSRPIDWSNAVKEDDAR